MDRGILRGKKRAGRTKKRWFLVGSAQNLPGNRRGSRRPCGPAGRLVYWKCQTMEKEERCMKNCPVCGQPVEEAWKACPHCGSPLGEEETGPRYAQTPGADPQGGETAGPRYAQSPGTGPRGGKSSGPRYAQTPGAGSGDYTRPVRRPGRTARPPRGGTPNHRPCGGRGRPSAHPSTWWGPSGIPAWSCSPLASTFRTGAAALTDTVLAQLLGNVYSVQHLAGRSVQLVAPSLRRLGGVYPGGPAAQHSWWSPASGCSMSRRQTLPAHR